MNHTKMSPRENMLHDFLISCKKVSESKKKDTEKIVDYNYLIKTYGQILTVLDNLDTARSKKNRKSIKKYGVEINDFEG